MKTTSTTFPDSVTTPSELRPANFTRSTADLPAKFRREGRWHLIPLYHLVRLSDFGREGIERSGSFRFADHLYRNEASGRGWFGKWLDRRLLNLPSARAMRQRYREAIRTLERRLGSADRPVKVLAIPCGIPRDLSELLRKDPTLAGRIDYTGMDLDEEVVAAAREHLRDAPLLAKSFVKGDALDPSAYCERRFDVVLSTGLGEFLDDERLEAFYRNVFEALEPGGVFFTSATDFEPRSDYMLRAFEMNTNYRSTERIAEIFAKLPWRECEMETDPSGLQTFIRAMK